jgi:zinc transporter
MNDADGLIFAYLLDRQGGGRELSWEEIAAWQPEQGLLWLHFNRTGRHTEEWLEQKSGIEPIICDTLLADESRPRHTRFNDALLVILRGVNSNAGAEPEDMVAIRMWLEADRIITLRHRRLLAVNDILADLGNRIGPDSTGEFLSRISELLVEGMLPMIDELEDQMEAIEDKVQTESDTSAEQSDLLNEVRRSLISLRRHLAPQREVQSWLYQERVSWLDPDHRTHLHETADELIRCYEDINELRDRTGVTQDQINTRISNQLNRTIYLLTVIATVLLPLTFVTGLLGINVAGIPGAENPLAFVAVVVVLVLLAALEFLLLRRLKMI